MDKNTGIILGLIIGLAITAIIIIGGIRPMSAAISQIAIPQSNTAFIAIGSIGFGLLAIPGAIVAGVLCRSVKLGAGVGGGSAVIGLGLVALWFSSQGVALMGFEFITPVVLLFGVAFGSLGGLGGGLGGRSGRASKSTAKSKQSESSKSQESDEPEENTE